MASNGTLLDEVLMILQEGKDIPEMVTNRLIFAAQVQAFRKVEALEKRVLCLEEEARKAVTWPYVLRTFLFPAATALITLGVAYVFSRLAGAP